MGMNKSTKHLGLAKTSKIWGGNRSNERTKPIASPAMEGSKISGEYGEANKRANKPFWRNKQAQPNRNYGGGEADRKSPAMVGSKSQANLDGGGESRTKTQAKDQTKAKLTSLEVAAVVAGVRWRFPASCCRRLPWILPPRFSLLSSSLCLSLGFRRGFSRIWAASWFPQVWNLKPLLKWRNQVAEKRGGFET